MKKMTLVLAMLMFVAPALGAQDNVTITATDEGGGWVAISYTADQNVISAFGLDITVTDGNIVEIADFNVGECNSAMQGYGIFMGSITIDGEGQVTDYNNPIASQSDLPEDTQPGLDSNGITTEMGALYEDGNAPPLSGTLCRIRIADVPIPCPCTGPDCYVNVTLNNSRGGVVMNAKATGALGVNLTGAQNVGVNLYDLYAYADTADLTGTPWYPPVKDCWVDLQDFTYLVYTGWWNQVCSTLPAGVVRDGCNYGDITGTPWFPAVPDGKIDLQDFTYIVYTGFWNQHTCRPVP